MRFERYLQEVILEREAAEKKHGSQLNIPLGCDSSRKNKADYARDLCESARKRNRLTWRHVLTEEIEEAFAESDPALIRKELLQSCAVIFAMLEVIDNTEVK